MVQIVIMLIIILIIITGLLKGIDWDCVGLGGSGVLCPLMPLPPSLQAVADRYVLPLVT